MGNQAMPRLGLSVSDSFGRQAKTKANSYGRQIRHVEGLRVVGARDYFWLFLKATLMLALIATATTSIAIWRLFASLH
jgi:hypothetical protein